MMAACQTRCTATAAPDDADGNDDGSWISSDNGNGSNNGYGSDNGSSDDDDDDYTDQTTV